MSHDPPASSPLPPNPRVAAFTNSYSPRLVGPTIAIENLKAGLFSDGAGFLVFAPEYRSVFARRASEADVVRLPSYRLFGVRRWALPILPLAGARISRALDAFQPDVIHVHQPFALGMAGVREARRRGIPVIYTFHTFYDHYTHYATRLARSLADRYVRRRMQNFLQAVHLIVVPTLETARQLHEQGVRTPVTVIPTGVCTQKFSGDWLQGTRVRRELGVAPGQKLLLHVGRIVKEKRIGFLLDMLEELLRREEDALLVLVGSGTQLNSMRRQSEKRGLATHIRWVGARSQAELPAYYAAADLFVFASLSDTQAIVLYEALSSGLPVIATDSLAARAAIRTPDCGVITANEAGAFADAVSIAVRQPGVFAPTLDPCTQIENTIARYQAAYQHVVATWREHAPAEPSFVSMDSHPVSTDRRGPGGDQPGDHRPELHN